MGGVNLVDHGPWNGAYQSTQVTGNTFIARDAMMKVGVAMGLMVWGGYNDSSFRTSGGVVTNNKFLSNGGEGYFAYGMCVPFATFKKKRSSIIDCQRLTL